MAKNCILQGLVNEYNFCSCSHCVVSDKPKVIDEIPTAYKDIDAVMTAQK
ncbi:RtcB family protein [Gilliamella sp. B3172]|nr:RtcB family protein [Gilliamella sp. B3172]